MNIYIVMYPVLVTGTGSPVIRSRQPGAWPKASLPAAGNDQLFAKHQYLCTDDMQQQKNNFYNVVNTVPNINKNLPVVVVRHMCKQRCLHD